MSYHLTVATFTKMVAAVTVMAISVHVAAHLSPVIAFSMFVNLAYGGHG